MCVAYTALLNGEQVVLKTPLPDNTHADVAANDLEVSGLVAVCSLLELQFSEVVMVTLSEICVVATLLK